MYGVKRIFERRRDMDIRKHGDYVIYQNTISMVYLKAAKDVLPDVTIEIDNSLNKGFYTLPSEPVSKQQVDAISARMKELIEADLPIIKEDGIYRLEDHCDYFYGGIAPSTGCAKLFELRKYAEGILLRFPYPTDPDVLPEYHDDKNLHIAFSEAKKWQQLLGVNYMPDLNEKIAGGKAKDLILLSEALHEKKIAEMADMITEGKKRIILIAGPSSSGKTTTAKRLSVQLRVNGLEPLYMGTDDYFVERSETPVDESGKPDYEGLGALDIELFNSNMNDLLAGREVDLPEFDFVKGTKIFGKRIMSIREDQPIIIEGIHALNGKLTEAIPDEEKFRIYISPFTQLNIDMHNRVPTTDARMLRRMVRDYKYRGKSAAGTIDQWSQVRAGEDENIFPFNGEADVVFNTVLTYELAVLKKYAQPLLEEIKEDQPEYSEARRLLELISGFDIIEDERAIPNNSILREFIGGSIFVE
ncbi:MAG: nucleoside kinase [Firmicutes bacterium]|nr:nucleoside kinase [Bacillota bacterium]MBQ4595671.1 nucleoside kinase [Bacillota bacterium]